MDAQGGTVRHVPEGSRYEYVIDGEVVGVADYRMCAGQVVMHHTVTVPERRGEGIAAHLVAGVLDDVRAEGRHVVPTCWFVAKYIDAHPEYHDLLPELTESTPVTSVHDPSRHVAAPQGYAGVPRADLDPFRELRSIAE